MQNFEHLIETLVYLIPHRDNTRYFLVIRNNKSPASRRCKIHKTLLSGYSCTRIELNWATTFWMIFSLDVSQLLSVSVTELPSVENFPNCILFSKKNMGNINWIFNIHNANFSWPFIDCSKNMKNNTAYTWKPTIYSNYHSV